MQLLDKLIKRTVMN